MRKDFFALKEELVPRITKLENEIELFYFRCGLFEKEPSGCKSILDYSELGKNFYGDHIHNDRFLVIKGTERVNVRAVNQVTGEINYAIDQLENKHSIIFEPGGIYKEMHLVHGCITTISRDPNSINLFNFFSKNILYGFKKMGAFYVSEGAIRLNEKGGRLVTISINSPEEYDLKL